MSQILVVMENDFATLGDRDVWDPFLVVVEADESCHCQPWSCSCLRPVYQESCWRFWRVIFPYWHVYTTLANCGQVLHQPVRSGCTSKRVHQPEGFLVLDYKFVARYSYLGSITIWSMFIWFCFEFWETWGTCNWWEWWFCARLPKIILLLNHRDNEKSFCHGFNVFFCHPVKFRIIDH